MTTVLHPTGLPKSVFQIDISLLHSAIRHRYHSLNVPLIRSEMKGKGEEEVAVQAAQVQDVEPVQVQAREELVLD